MINAAAVLERLRETDARSGGRREAWTEPWLAERRELDAQARAVSDAVTVERDAFANTWYVLAGRRTETILIASHSDCVPGGGWLDGILGVQAGLEILVSTAKRGPPERTLAVVDWADEEGTRFGRSLLGSAAATGALSSAELAALAGADGTPATKILAEYGFDVGALGTPSPRLTDVVAALELHIEQGPRLQAAGPAVAAVTGCLGVRRRRMTFTGVAGHSGSLPMAERRDPVRAAAALLTELFAAAQDTGGLATAGELSAEPSLITAVPARCHVGLDLRHAELTALDALERRARELAAGSSCSVEIADVYDQDPIHFDTSLVRAARAATDGGGDALMSGPLHDSAALAQAGVPVAMLFVASIGGISHTRDEDSAEFDLVAGLEALYRLAEPLLAGETWPSASRRDG
jgi:hydantoinase/carbamoylase family amidase